MAHRGRRTVPGPDDPSVLTQQADHVSELIWNGQGGRLLWVRRAQHKHHEPPPEKILPQLKVAGFMGVAMADYSSVDHSLIKALVERWRPKTHTFHLPPGETTVTLQDVAVLLGLPIDGHAGIGLRSWIEVVEVLLGISLPPDTDVINAGRLRMNWLDQHFKELPAEPDDETMTRFARAYILRLIGGVIFSDHSTTFVSLHHLLLLEDLNVTSTYSWGLACLAYLYKELCKATHYKNKEICGCTVLLQAWAWERFPKIASTITVPMLVAFYGFVTQVRR